MKTALTTIVCLLPVWAAESLGAWGTSGCGPVGPLVAQRSFLRAPYQNVRDGWELDRGIWYYFSRGSQVAAYNPTSGVYRTYDSFSNVWGSPTAPPWQKPAEAKKAAKKKDNCTCGDNCECIAGNDCGCLENTNANANADDGSESFVPDSKSKEKPSSRADPGDDPKAGKKVDSIDGKKVDNYGIEYRRLLRKGQPESYTINGTSVSQSTAAKAVAGPSGIGADLIDDSTKLRVTVIGPPDARKPVMLDIEKSPVLAPLKDRVLVQEYAPDHWAVAKTGFVTTGKPTVYVQAPDGKVLSRQDDYDGGPEALAAAIRKADPSYDPTKDKDLRKADDPSAGLMAFLQTPWAWLCGIAAAVILWAKTRKATP